MSRVFGWETTACFCNLPRVLDATMFGNYYFWMLLMSGGYYNLETTMFEGHHVWRLLYSRADYPMFSFGGC